MSTEAKVGAFVMASVLVLGSAAYFVHTTQTVKGQVPYRTQLRYAGGLAPGALVLFGGIKVGQVTAVRPSPKDPTRIEIAFDVKSGTPLNQDSKAQVGAISVMSSPALSISTGNNNARRLGPGELVPSQESVSIGEITNSVAAVTESANELMTQLRREIPAMTRQARMLLANLNEISGPKNQLHVEQILAGVNGGLSRELPKIARITDQISQLAKDADSVVVGIQPVLDNVGRTVTNIDNTVTAVRDPLTKDLAELESTIRDARTLLSSVQEIVNMNEGNIAETMQNLRTSSENVRALSETLKQRPWNLVRTTQPADRKVPK